MYAGEAGECSLAGQPAPSLESVRVTKRKNWFWQVAVACQRFHSGVVLASPALENPASPKFWSFWSTFRWPPFCGLECRGVDLGKWTDMLSVDPYTLGLQEKGRLLIRVFSAAAVTPYLCRVRFTLRLYHFSFVVLSWSRDRPEYWPTLYHIHLGRARPMQDLDLLDNSGHAYLQLWWMNQSHLKIQMCFRNENSRRSKTVSVVCTTYRSLEHTALFWKLFKYVFIFFFSMSSWRAGTVLRSHYLGPPLRARYLTHRIIVPLIKWMCILNTHSITPQTLSYSCSEMNSHFRLIKSYKSLTLI